MTGMEKWLVSIGFGGLVLTFIEHIQAHNHVGVSVSGALVAFVLMRVLVEGK